MLLRTEELTESAKGHASSCCAHADVDRLTEALDASLREA